MIANAVECFGAQVKGNQRDVGTPDCMVETFGNERAEGIFTGVTPWTVTAVVAKRDGFGECNVEAECARHSGCNLGNFESVCEASALVVLREYEHLRFASESAKC